LGSPDRNTYGCGGKALIYLHKYPQVVNNPVPLTPLWRVDFSGLVR